MIYSIFNFIKKAKLRIIISIAVVSFFAYTACDTDLRELDKKIEDINKTIDEKVGNIDSLINKKVEKVDSLVKDKIDSILIK